MGGRGSTTRRGAGRRTTRPLGAWNGYWGWAPGPIVVRPVYAPALVAFFGALVGVSVTVGNRS